MIERPYQLCRTYGETRTDGMLWLSSGGYIKTIELPWNDNKVGESCIPEGAYKVVRDRHGKHTWFKIQDVKGRSFREMHEGYKPSHSLGCILSDIVSLQDLIIDSKGENFLLEICS